MNIAHWFGRLFISFVLLLRLLSGFLSWPVDWTRRRVGQAHLIRVALTPASCLLSFSLSITVTASVFAPISINFCIPAKRTSRSIASASLSAFRFAVSSGHPRPSSRLLFFQQKLPQRFRGRSLSLSRRPRDLRLRSSMREDQNLRDNKRG